MTVTKRSLSSSSSAAAPKSPDPHSFLNKTEMGQQIRAFAWEKSSLGPFSSWPQSLKAALSIILESPIAMAVLWGSDGIMLYNDAYAALAGAKHPTILGAKVVDGWPEVAKFSRNIMSECLKGETLSYKEHQLTLFRHGVAETVWLDLNYSPVHDENGKPAGVLAIVVEITDRLLAEKKQQQAETALHAEQDRLYRLFMQAPAPVVILRGPDHIIDLANPLALKVLNKTKQIIKLPLMKAVPELAGQGFKELLDGVYTTGKNFYGQEQKAQFDQGHGKLEDAYFTFVYEPMRDQQGKVEGIMILAYTVTSQVLARERAEAQNQVLEMITSGAPLSDALELLVQSIEKQSGQRMKGSILLLDNDKKHLRHGAAPSLPKQYNKAFDGIAIGPNSGSCGTAAYTKKAVVVSDITTSPLWKDFKVLAEKYGLRACWSTPILSSNKRLLGTFAVYYDEPQKPSTEDKQIVNFATRTASLILENNKMELESQESARRFEIMADNIQNLAWMANADGWIFWYNRRWYDYTGTTLDEMKGWGWEKVHHPDHVKNVTDFVKIAWHKDEPFELTFPLRGKDGQYRWFLTRCVPVHDKDGKIERWIGTNTDIEDLKQRHVMEERMKLLTEQRNALLKINKTKDEFIGLASHQLRTPATAVKQYIGLLINNYAGPLTSDQNRYLQIAYDSNERELNIINDLLKTAQMDSTKYKLDKQKCDIVSIIKDCVDHLQTSFDQMGQEVVVSSPLAVLRVGVDAREIKLVFVNLLENASKYSYTGTEIKISIQHKDKYAEITIADKGVGIGKADQQRIFDKFTRVDNELSDTVSGTGLGLYWVKRLLELHKGSVRLASVPGKGSKFTIRLPL